MAWKERHEGNLSVWRAWIVLLIYTTKYEGTMVWGENIVELRVCSRWFSLIVKILGEEKLDYQKKNFLFQRKRKEHVFRPMRVIQSVKISVSYLSVYQKSLIQRGQWACRIVTGEVNLSLSICELKNRTFLSCRYYICWTSNILSIQIVSCIYGLTSRRKLYIYIYNLIASDLFYHGKGSIQPLLQLILNSVVGL